MMSFNLAASYLGQSLGGGLGGLVLIVYGYSGMSFGLGILGVVAGLVYFFKAIDPTLAQRETRQIFSGNNVAQ
jgi:predicted MFS family arabinose efflux permease